jgi:hypothetical protein
MKAITRREAIYTSGFLLAAPLSGAFASAGAATQSPGASGSNVSSPAYNMDLHNWVQAQIPELARKVRTGTATKNDFHETSGRVRLLAKHIGTLDIDSKHAQIAAQINPAICDFSTTETASAVIRHFQAHIPGLTPSEMKQYFVFKPSDILSCKTSLIEHPLSWHLHTYADAIKSFAGMPDYLKASQHVGAQPMLMSATYSPSNVSAKLLAVDGFCFNKQKACQAITGLLALGFSLSAVLAGFLPESPAVLALAVSLGFASVGALIAFLAGAAAIAGFYSIFC